jgi:type VI secretion system secreted protein Hcp
VPSPASEQDWNFNRRIAMALQSYLTLQGQTQGKFKGPSRKGSARDGIEIQSFNFGVETPFDPGSGQAVGKRRHNPIQIVREVDSPSPLLFQALSTQERFTSAVVNFTNPSTGVSSGPVRTIELKNSFISSITHSPNSGGKRRERITFEYDDSLVNGLSNIVIHSV